MTFESLKAASSWTGYPLSVIKRAKQSGCDAFVRHTVDLQKLIRWIAAAQNTASVLPDGFASWGEVLNHVKSEREKIRLGKDARAVMEVADARKQAAEAEGFYFNELARMEREMPAALAGLTADQVRAKLKKFLETLRGNSREKFKNVCEPEPK